MGNITKKKKREDILLFNTVKSDKNWKNPLNSQYSYIAGVGHSDLGGVVLLAQGLDLGGLLSPKYVPFQL